MLVTLNLYTFKFKDMCSLQNVCLNLTTTLKEISLYIVKEVMVYNSVLFKDYSKK